MAFALVGLWLGRTLGELLTPLFKERRREACVFAPAEVMDEDLRTYSAATRATDASASWWEGTLQYIVDVMHRERATWIVPDSMAKPSDPFLRLRHNSRMPRRRGRVVLAGTSAGRG